MGFVTRFAPSPTGALHHGHAFSALTAQAAATTAGGRFLLRIEDIDTQRCHREYETGIFEDLAWLGLTWEQPVRKQSDHYSDYARALERLREAGLIYRCFRTRRDLAQAAASAPHGLPTPFVGAPLSPREEGARLAAGDAFAWRLSLAAAEKFLGGFERLTFNEEGAGPAGEHGRIQARPGLGGDVILGRKGVGVAYHLAVVVDDALQNISHVIRAEDLFEAAHVQRLLQALLDLPTPVYRHHRLLRDAQGKRFAKRDRAQTLAEIRAAGVTPTALRAELGFA